MPQRQSMQSRHLINAHHGRGQSFGMPQWCKNVIFASAHLTRVELTAGDISTSLYKKLNKVIKPINDAIRNNKFCYSSSNMGKTISWQIFYLLKEIISYCECNYYRGQSDNYTLNPGILRKSINEEYLNRFEDEYLELSRTYPNQLSYYKPQKFLERESALSLLQHYGFKTSLLDITSDPYIAMLFMMSNSINLYKEPTLYLFDVDIINNGYVTTNS